MSTPFDQIDRDEDEDGAFVYALDHVQLAMPPGGEDLARAFYGDVLRLAETPKPANLAKRGGVWFVSGLLKIHLGVDQDFRPVKKAHPALLVKNLDKLVERCTRNGYPTTTDEPLVGFRRVYVADPFGNRIELMEAISSEQ